MRVDSVVVVVALMFLVFAGAAIAQSSTTVGATEMHDSVRVAESQPVMERPGNDDGYDTVRLHRSFAPPVFFAPPHGVAQRWLRNMRHPSFCPFVLCHGTCADVIGRFIIGGNCAPTESSDAPAPCSIRKVDFFAPGAAGCCSSAPGASPITHGSVNGISDCRGSNCSKGSKNGDSATLCH